MLRKGVYGICEDHERKPYGDDRVEEVEKDLTETPGLREM